MKLDPLYDWASTVFIGFFVVTYWRCTWVLIDILGCGQPEDATLVNGDTFCWAVFPLYPDQIPARLNNARASYAIGIGLLIVGVFIMWMGWWVPKNADKKVTPLVTVIRFCAVYILGASAVNVWRGVWYWADDWIFPDEPLKSYWTTSLVGSTVAFLLCGGKSLLAAPSVFLLDGPGLSSPPIAVTLLSAYYDASLPADEAPPELSVITKLSDMFLSFGVLPFAVVWYWRGSWLVLDNYFYGFTIYDEDVDMSLLWCTIFTTVLFGITSEPVVGFLGGMIKNKFLTSCLGRLRTYLLAWGTVSFWRIVWLVWDQFLGGTSTLSAATGHVVAIVVLTSIGCVSAIAAPASTMCTDRESNPMAADDPLFFMLPVPHESLHIFGIGRQPKVSDEPSKSKGKIEMEDLTKETERQGDGPDDDIRDSGRFEGNGQESGNFENAVPDAEIGKK